MDSIFGEREVIDDIDNCPYCCVPEIPSNNTAAISSFRSGTGAPNKNEEGLTTKTTKDSKGEGETTDFTDEHGWLSILIVISPLFPNS